MYLGECEAIRGETLCPVTSLLLSCDTHGWLCKHWQEGSQCFFVHVNMSQGQQLELISRLIRCKCFLPRTLLSGFSAEPGILIEKTIFILFYFVIVFLLSHLKQSDERVWSLRFSGQETNSEKLKE